MTTPALTLDPTLWNVAQTEALRPEVVTMLDTLTKHERDLALRFIKAMQQGHEMTMFLALKAMSLETANLVLDGLLRLAEVEYGIQPSDYSF